MVVAGMCRLLARKGIRVAPFKAQNMSNNSAVTIEGGEIGRAQAMQARAAGLAPSVRFNPVLLKPGSDRTSQLVVRGSVVDTVGATDYFTHREQSGSCGGRRIARPEKQNSTLSSSKVRARLPRSTCVQPISPTWGWPAPLNCRSSSSATSTAAGCWPTCTAQSRCSSPRTSGSFAGSWSTSSAATPRCWLPG